MDTQALDWWRSPLTYIGQRAMRGQSVELLTIRPTDPVSEAAAGALIDAIDAVLSAATNPPGSSRKHRIPTLEDALTEYYLASAWCLGLSLHVANGDELLDEIFDELRAARDSLVTLDRGHWNASAFYDAVAAAEKKHAPTGLRPKLARFSFAYDDSRAAANAA